MPSRPALRTRAYSVTCRSITREGTPFARSRGADPQVLSIARRRTPGTATGRLGWHGDRGLQGRRRRQVAAPRRDVPGRPTARWTPRDPVGLTPAGGPPLRLDVAEGRWYRDAFRTRKNLPVLPLLAPRGDGVAAVDTDAVQPRGGWTGTATRSGHRAASATTPPAPPPAATRSSATPSPACRAGPRPRACRPPRSKTSTSLTPRPGRGTAAERWSLPVDGWVTGAGGTCPSAPSDAGGHRTPQAPIRYPRARGAPPPRTGTTDTIRARWTRQRPGRPEHPRRPGPGPGSRTCSRSVLKNGTDTSGRARPALLSGGSPRYRPGPRRAAPPCHRQGWCAHGPRLRRSRWSEVPPS